MEIRNTKHSIIIALSVVIFFLVLLSLEHISGTNGLFVLSIFVAPFITLYYFISYLLSIVYIFRRKFIAQSFLPVTILTIGILLIIGIFAIEQQIKLDLDKRNQLIEEIKKNRFRIENGQVALPPEFEELSIGKHVRVEYHRDSTLTIEFYYESLIGDNFTTLHYTNNSSEIQKFERYIKDYDDYCKKVDDGWYFLYH